MTEKTGWQGRFYEDFEVGDVYQHPLGRTVTTTDNIWFTLLTQNTAPIHFDHHFAAQTEFGKPLVDSTFTLALVTGQSVTDISQNVFANLGWDEVRFPKPLFHGDTIHVESEVLLKRPSKSRPGQGIVEFMHQIDHGMLHALAQAEVAALAPATDGIAPVLEEAAQRPRRGVRSNQPGQHQHRMPVTPGRETEQRQGAKEGAQFRNGAPLQKHQGSGRRRKRLCSNGHHVSSRVGPFTSRQPATGSMK
jgi:acyl dehydratase